MAAESYNTAWTSEAVLWDFGHPSGEYLGDSQPTSHLCEALRPSGDSLAGHQHAECSDSHSASCRVSLLRRTLRGVLSPRKPGTLCTFHPALPATEVNTKCADEKVTDN